MGKQARTIDFTPIDEQSYVGTANDVSTDEKGLTPDPPKKKTAPTINFTPLDEPVKKKDESASPSSIDFTEDGKPSKESSPKSTPSKYQWDPKVSKWTNLYRELVHAYNTPATPEQKEKPDPFINAIKRGTKAAEQAGILGPFEGKPTLPKIERVAELQKETRELPPSESFQKFSKAESFGDALSEFAKDPAKIMVELTAESLSSMIQYGSARVATGAAVGAAGGTLVAPGPGTIAGAGGGAIVGMADTSLGLEFTGSFLESLQEAGVDTSDPAQLKTAFEDDAVISKAREHAFKKGIPIALFDLLSGGIAGKIVSKPAKSLIGKVGAGAVELAAQSLMGAGGELAGQVVAGEKIQPGAILAEAIGETAFAPVEVATGALTYNKSPTQVVQEQTEVVNTADAPSISNKADVIQDKVDKMEAQVVSGNTDAQEIVINDQATSAPPTPGVEQQAPVSETQAEKEVSPQAEPEVTETEVTQNVTDSNIPQTKYVTEEESGTYDFSSTKQTQDVDQQSQPSDTPGVTQDSESTTQSDPVSATEGEEGARVSPQGQGTPEVVSSDPTATEQPTEGVPPTNQTGSVALDEPAPQRVSGIKKALVPEDKIEGTPIEKRSMLDTLNKAKEQVDAGEVNPKAIVDEIATGNARALQSDEVASLVYYKTQLDNKSDRLNADMVAAIEADDVQAQAQLRPQLDAINQEIDNYHTMSLKTAYEQSLAFNMRKLLLDNEYNLAYQVNAYKAANNGVIPAEVEERFKDMDTRLKAANARIQQLEEEQSKSKGQSAMQDVRQDLQRQREVRKKTAQMRKEKINDFFNSLKVKTDPNKLNSITQVIGEAVFNGAIETIRVAVLAGSNVATAIQAGIDYINEHYRGNDFNEGDFRAIVQPGLEKIIPTEPDIPKARMQNNKLFLPQAMIRDYVEQGVTDIEDLVNQIYEDIKEEFPDISKREIRDAITRYGETRTLSKDEINVQLREMKRLGRLISSLEDVQNKKRPLRSGLQRDKLTDQERKLQREIKEEMKNLPIDEAEVEKSWRNALDAVKSRLRNQITDLEAQIKTGEKTPKKKGIEYDEEANALKTQRDKLKAIIESLEGKPKMSDEQRTRMAVAAVERTISDLENRIKKQDTSTKQKTVTRETPELKALREYRTELQKQYQQMEKDLGVADKKRLESYKESIRKATQKFEQRLRDKDFETKKKDPIVEDAELIKLKLERDKIKFQFDTEKEKVRLKNRPMSEKVWDTFLDLWNIPKSLLASIDMSAPFRQGALLSISNPGAGARSFTEMFRQAFSAKKAEEWLLKLRDSDIYPLIRNSKLYVAEPNTKLTAKEEHFMSNFAGKLPLIGFLIRGSERAYTGYLNKLRVDVFANGVDRLREQGITPEKNPEAYKSWANFINNATGRGNLGGMELAAPVLNGLFFSPRYIASRFNLLNPVTYAKMPPAVRQMALKSALTYIGFTALFVTLLGTSDELDVEWDPRSSDFGKVRFGNTRYDPWAGFQQVVRLLAQLITGQRKSTKTGKVSDLNSKTFPYDTRADVVLNFLRSKMAPVPGTLWNLAEGENIVGEEVTPQSEIFKNVVPLYMQDLKEIYDQEGPTGIITTAIPAFFGIGVQNYAAKKPAKEEKK